jgi:gliding motility-associated-like protein
MIKRLASLPLLILLFTLFTGNKVEASHMMGVDLTYECMNACTIRVYLRAYRDCSGASGITNQITFTPLSGGCGQPQSLGGWSPQVTTEVTPVCPGAPTGCTTPGASINGVEEYYWFQDFNICNVPGCIFQISWGSCCRNGSIGTGPANEGMFINATTLNTNIIPCNSSPQFTNPPVPYICQGQPYIFNQGAVDPEGDSLAYSLGTCYDTQNNPVTYNAGVSPTQPLGSSWNVNMNANTGDILVTPQPGNLITAVMCVYVEEWRNGTLINTIVRDIQMTVIPCPNNTVPSSTGVTNLSGGVASSAWNITVCAGTPINFNIPVVDPNATQSHIMFWNQAIAGATFTGPGGQVDTITGVTPTATFNWTPPSVGVFTFLVTIQDNACPVTGQSQYTCVINVQGGLPNASITATPTGCTNVNLNANPGTGGTGPYSYVWYGDGNLNVNPNNTTQSFNHTYPGPGSYIANVQVTDNFGCVSVLTDTVVIASGPTADAGPDITLCSGFPIQLGNPNLPLGQTYTWTPNTGLTGANTATPTLNYVNNTASPVTLNYVTTATTGFCTAIDYVTVVVYPTPTATISGNTNICLGQSTTLTANGGTSYLWSNGATTNSITVSPTSTTTYTVSAVNAGCTSPPAQVTVNVSQGPSVIITGTDSVCGGGSAVLTAAGGSTWSWSTGATTQSITLSPVNGPTSVTVTASQNGCQGPPASYTVNVFNQPVANFSATTVCVEGPTSFTDLSSITPGGNGTNGGIVGWVWNFGDPVSGTNNTSTSPNPTHTFSAPGTFNVTLTATSYNGCRDAITLPVTVNPLPQPDFAFSDVCIGEVMTFAETTPGNITSYLWDFAGQGTSNQANPTFIFQAPGSYNVTLTVTNNNGCVASRTKTVFVHPNPVPQFTFENHCFNSYTNFFSQSFITDPFGTTLDAHSWNFGDPNSGPDNTSVEVNPEHTWATYGLHYVTLTVTSSQGCSESLEIPIVIEAAPQIPVVDDTVCGGFSAFVQATNPMPGFATLEWFYTPTSTEPFQTGVNFFNTPPLASNTTYWLAMRDADGCLSPKWGVVAYVIGQPYVDILVNSQELEIPSAILEITTANMTNGPISTYVWDFGDGATSGEPQPVHQYTEEGVYDLMLTATNWFGCVGTITLPDHITVTKNVRLFVPTAFTPDGNGVNDVFNVVTRLVTDLEIDIYDRWGKQVFASKDINFSWDGTFAGAPLPEGVYTYSIRATEWSGEKISRAGTVTLLR